MLIRIAHKLAISFFLPVNLNPSLGVKEERTIWATLLHNPYGTTIIYAHSSISKGLAYHKYRNFMVERTK